MKRRVGAWVVFTLTASTAFGGDLQDSIARAAASQTQQQTTTSRPNRLLWPGIALVGGGTVMALVGFLRPNGVEVTIQPTPSFVPAVSVRTTHSVGLGVTGLGVAGVGGVLLILGARNPPVVTVTPERHGISVARTVRF